MSAPFVAHTDAEIAEMLAFLGLEELDDLFAEIPEALRLTGGLDLPPAMSEPDVAWRLEDLAAKNRPCGRELICFAGAGSYDHEIPAVVKSLASRSEFVTAYTPYQPEVSQGVLQAIFEFQTMVARLAGLDVANASLYDGAAALVEASEPRRGGHRPQAGAVLQGRAPALAPPARDLRGGFRHRDRHRRRSPAASRLGTR